tara:strand:- start:241 stop:633 length:393 start_codon:yes stop_codon:yes gene_type:complete
MAGLAPKLPLHRDDLDGYALIKDFGELVAQNFKMLMLTSPGERLMDPLFGVGIKRFLFEQNHESTHTRIEMEIRSQVRKYMPFLEIRNIQFFAEDNYLTVRIRYFIKPIKKTQSFTLRENYQLNDLPSFE